MIAVTKFIRNKRKRSFHCRSSAQLKHYSQTNLYSTWKSWRTENFILYLFPFSFSLFIHSNVVIIVCLENMLIVLKNIPPKYVWKGITISLCFSILIAAIRYLRMAFFCIRLFGYAEWGAVGWKTISVYSLGRLLGYVTLSVYHLPVLKRLIWAKPEISDFALR